MGFPLHVKLGFAFILRVIVAAALEAGNEERAAQSGSYGKLSSLIMPSSPAGRFVEKHACFGNRGGA